MKNLITSGPDFNVLTQDYLQKITINQNIDKSLFKYETVTSLNCNLKDSFPGILIFTVLT